MIPLAHIDNYLNSLHYYCMGVILSNPRYERLAQCLAAGMRQSDIAKELDYSEASISLLKDNKEIQSRLNELLVAHAQNSIKTTAIADLNERKKLLTDILRHKTETPISAGHRIAAAREINLMERVYQESSSSSPVVSINVIIPDSHNLYSANLPQPATTIIDAANQTPVLPPSSEKGEENTG